MTRARHDQTRRAQRRPSPRSAGRITASVARQLGDRPPAGSRSGCSARWAVSPRGGAQTCLGDPAPGRNGRPGRYSAAGPVTRAAAYDQHRVRVRRRSRGRRRSPRQRLADGGLARLLAGLEPAAGVSQCVPALETARGCSRTRPSGVHEQDRPARRDARDRRHRHAPAPPKHAEDRQASRCGAERRRAAPRAQSVTGCRACASATAARRSAPPCRSRRRPGRCWPPGRSRAVGALSRLAGDAVVAGVGRVVAVVAHHPQPALGHGHRPEVGLAATSGAVGVVDVRLVQLAPRAGRAVVADLHVAVVHRP